MQTQDPNNSKKVTLTEEELKETNGGGLLGNDNSSLTAITQGYLNVSHTDEDGDTNSLNTDFGTGSLFNSQND